MSLNLNDYQFKADMYSYGSTYLYYMITTKQKHTVESQRTKRKEFKHTTKENHQNTEGKTKRKRNEQRRTTKTTGKQGLKCL